MSKHLIDLATIRRLITYNSNTGEFHWVERPREMFPTRRHWLTWNTKNAGQRADKKESEGYRVVRMLGNRFKAHRLAWFYVYGAWPKGDIDHINRVRDDNRMANLRDVSSAINSRNMSRRNDNTSGITGVSFLPVTGKWHAYININGRRLHLGKYPEKADAVGARIRAEQELGFTSASADAA
jgi:hypothetical protein